uniref:Nudix hydrolase 13, mitochondrial n=1 Tax=Anthurium amnicola TaxID=1678845 RepID=A0A1D1YID1_9ARAE
MSSLVFADVVTSQLSFWSHLGAPGVRSVFCSKTFYKLSPQKEKTLGLTWKEHNKLRRKINFREGCLRKQNTTIIKAIATPECKFWVGSEDDSRHDSNMHLDSVSEYQVPWPSIEDSLKIDEREKMRRLKISKANKGNVPWNKGRKHSTETLQKIRERTRIAMQDPKVKMKLLNMGHAQSEETRLKIGAGVREGWRRRREMLLVQETCCLEWRNIIAEASRKGHNSDEELHWASCETLDEQLEKEWLESMEKRKTMPRPKGNKRAPKSPEQRRKISEAISAKWADPGYRDRVCSSLAKYYGIPVGVERKRRRKPVDESQSAEWKAVKKKPAEPKHTENEKKLIEKVIQRKRKTATPSYKDPMASSKLEMIKKIRERRATVEARKRVATERAKLLIAEAEEAAKALELAALTSPLARASLLETRKLIAEAIRAIERIESGQLTSQESEDSKSLCWGKPVNYSPTGPEAFVTDTSADGRQVNGTPVLSSNLKSDDDFDFSDFSKQNALNGREPLSEDNGAENSIEDLCNNDPSTSVCNSARKHSDTTMSQLDTSRSNGSFKYNYSSPTSEDKGSLHAAMSDASVASLVKTKKKWVRGRLVEVGEE